MMVGGYTSLSEGTRSDAISHRMDLRRRGEVPAQRLLELLLVLLAARRMPERESQPGRR